MVDGGVLVPAGSAGVVFERDLDVGPWACPAEADVAADSCKEICRTCENVETELNRSASAVAVLVAPGRGVVMVVSAEIAIVLDASTKSIGCPRAKISTRVTKRFKR